MTRLLQWLSGLLVARMAERAPDFSITGPDGAVYLHRYYVTRWRGWFANVADGQRSRAQRAVLWVTKHICNLYVHRFVGDDPQEILHDHPSWAVSLIVRNSYLEHTVAEGGVHHRREYRAGTVRFMSTRHVHRIELLRDASGQPIECWTLFLFGPALREWGFHCPKGWVHWKRFVAPGTDNQVQQGCGE